MTQPKEVSANSDTLELTADGPVLLGSHCGQCGRSYFPRRWECAVDQTPAVDVVLSTVGQLTSVTYVENPSYGRAKLDAEGYGVGLVDLPEGVRIQAILEGERDSWTVGTDMRLVTAPIGETEEGEAIVAFRFTSDK